VEEKGGLDHCRATMKELAQNAIAIIDSFPPGNAADALKETVEYTMNRRS
jgi:geranylgeranyl pyrophosphate synthase